MNDASAGTVAGCGPEPRLSIVVCTYNRAALLAGCLQSLIEQTLDHAVYEVIVVDNNSNDGTHAVVADWVSRFPFIHQVCEERQGLSHARNLGWLTARGEFVAYIDDDAVAAPDWGERILHAFDWSERPPAAVGGMILPRINMSPPRWFVPQLETRQWGDSAGFLQPPRAAYGFSGSNMAIAKSAFAEIGGFSAEFGMRGETVDFGEESDFFLRLYRKHPYFWYDPAIRVFHMVTASQLRLAGRIRRVFLAGKARRRYEGSRLSLSLLRGEARGFVDAFLDLYCSSGPLRYKAVAMLERIANRIGFLVGQGR